MGKITNTQQKSIDSNVVLAEFLMNLLQVAFKKKNLSSIKRPLKKKLMLFWCKFLKGNFYTLRACASKGDYIIHMLRETYLKCFKLTAHSFAVEH